MFNQEIEDKIKEIINSYKYIKYKCIIKRLSNDDIEYLNKKYPDNEYIEECIYLLINNLDKPPICPICGKKAKFSIEKTKYINTCGSQYCYRKYNRKMVELAYLEKYGVKNILQVTEVREKFKESWRNHSKEKTKEIVEKRRKYCLEHYGVDSKSKLPETIDKMFKTNLKKYGHICCLRNKEVIEKCKKTSLKIYGYEFPAQSPEVIDKQYKSKKDHNSFLGHTSKLELESKELLENKFKIVYHQYKTKEYPFVCDFYIKDLNLYIECNYFWTHGLHPFNENDINDINKLNIWKERNTKFFNSAIKTWTHDDLQKRKIAKENNLNWIEFFNINELKDWLKDK